MVQRHSARTVKSYFGHNKRADKRIRLKKVFKKEKLCYPVKEAHRSFVGCFTRSASAGSDRGNTPRNKSFHIRWRYISKEELSANMYSDRKVCLVGILGVGFRNDYVGGNHFSEVVHDETGKHFLVDVLHLFCMKMKQSNGILQITKRSLNAPTHA